MDTLLQILTSRWITILGFVVAPLYLLICATLYCQNKWGRTFSWIVGLSYLFGGSILFWGMGLIRQFYREFRQGTPMPAISKWVLSVHPLYWAILFLMLGAVVVWKDRFWHWRHANLICVTLLLLLVAGILTAASHPFFCGPTSWVS